MNCDCQHLVVCRHRIAMDGAIAPILTKYFGGFVNDMAGVEAEIQKVCQFRLPKAEPEVKK